jgi:hypothetical protein
MFSDFHWIGTVIDHFKIKHYGMNPESEDWNEEEMPTFPADKSSREVDLEDSLGEDGEKE